MAVPQDASGAGRPAEVRLPATAVPFQQATLDHAGQRGPYGVLGDPGLSEHLDQAARRHGDAPAERVDAEEGQHQRLRPRHPTRLARLIEAGHGGKSRSEPDSTHSRAEGKVTLMPLVSN